MTDRDFWTTLVVTLILLAGGAATCYYIGTLTSELTS